jgi:hypothetical protein
MLFALYRYVVRGRGELQGQKDNWPTATSVGWRRWRDGLEARTGETRRATHSDVVWQSVKSR